MNAAAVSAALEGRRWLHASYAYALLVAGVLGYFLMRIPIQVYDCFSDIASLSRPMGDLVRDAVWASSYLRPGRYVELKIVYDLAGGEYHYAFRLVHVAHVVLLVVLFVRLVQPRTLAAAVSLPLALAVLIGNHTFAWTVREAFPINHYLTVVVACAAAANLPFARHRWWIDALAVALFLAAALTIESGVLIWVILAGAYAVGLRGVSRRGVLAVTACMALYFVLRFAVLDVGLPGLADREAGFGFRRYNSDELQQMFGDGPLAFYAYNVLMSVVGMLTGEPRDGVFRLTDALRRGEPHWPLVIGVVSSTLATVVVCRFVWVRRRAWLARRFEREDQLMVLFWLVLAANAAMAYAYTKDVIMAPAGFFLAVAVFVACRDLVEGLSAGRAAVVAVALLTVLSCTWAVRAVGIHAALAETALDVREQWAYSDEWFAHTWSDGLPPHVRALRQQLQADAIVNHPARPPLRERWTRLFELE